MSARIASALIFAIESYPRMLEAPQYMLQIIYVSMHCWEGIASDKNVQSSNLPTTLRS